ncbi:hypothetical protein [Sporomusa aerivorans]|uniref:hypothetical protein n=1 Tax=Sporomusa aerivorans TaxID=204936 RepID=UPI00352BB5E2
MTKLEKGMLVVADVSAPSGSPAKIVYEGPGQGNQYGQTLFHVFLDDMSYGVFSMRGEIATLEDARKRLSSPKCQAEQETVAEYAVRYQWLHLDDNDLYNLGD